MVRSGFAKLLAVVSTVPTLASMGGCEPPVCSLFGEQIEAEGCGESAKLNSNPQVPEFSFPRATLPNQLRLYRVVIHEPDGDRTLVEWDFDGDGDYEKAGRPTAVLGNGDLAAEVHWQHRRLGTYTVRARVSDYPKLPGGEGVTIVERRVHVITQADFDANRDPVARLTVPEPVLAGTEVVLDASASFDPDGGPLTYEWFPRGTGSSAAPDNSRHQAVFPEEKQETVTVRVTDEYGATDEVREIFWAWDPIRRPTAALKVDPRHVRTGRSVTFNAGETRVGGYGYPAQYEWDLDGEPGFELSTGTTDWAMRSYHTPGHRSVRVRVTNTMGFVDFAGADVWVGDGPNAVLTASPARPCVGDAVAFSADDSTDPDDDIVRYQWDLDGDAGFERDSTEPRAEHVFRNAGTHFVSMRVTDATGNDDTATLELMVDECADTPPSAELQAEPNPAQVGNEVRFFARQQRGNVIRYHWDLDGTQGYEQETVVPETTHTYSASNEYVVRLRVVDAAGRDHVSSLTLPVAPALRGYGRVTSALPPWLDPRATAAATRRAAPRPFSAELRDTAARRTVAGMLGGAGRARAWLGGAGRLTRAERSMRRFLRSRWRTGVRFATRGAGRATVRGLVLAEPSSRGRRSRACARVALDLRAGRLPRGKLTILGGSGAAARLRGTATFRFRVDPSGHVSIVGNLRATLGRPRALPPSCKAL
jgi:PKD repeat protein